MAMAEKLPPGEHSRWPRWCSRVSRSADEHENDLGADLADAAAAVRAGANRGSSAHRHRQPEGWKSRRVWAALDAVYERSATAIDSGPITRSRKGKGASRSF